MVNVVTCDDHGIFSLGLRLILEACNGYKVIKQYGTGKDLIAGLSEADFHLLLLDVNLPDRNGIDLVKQVKNIKPLSKILMLSMHEDNSIAMRSLKAGAEGYLHKNASKEELTGAIETILRGGYGLDEKSHQKLLGNMKLGPLEGLPHHLLSDRELEVLILLGSGSSNSEISNSLNLSPKTISTYKQRILQKLQLDNHVQLYSYVQRHRLSGTALYVN